MGVVYEAFDPVVERTVAIKTIALGAENPAELVERLKKEARSVGQLEHPNIVTLYDAAEAGGVFYLVMQYIAGETLRQWLTRRGRLPLSELRDLFRQICSGLHFAHQRGVIHRDVKPANIMITPEGRVKLTDFGIAKLPGGASTLTRGLIVGTPSYMSPEQALGQPLDCRSDIFSLGTILYELVTGEQPFSAESATTIIYKIVHEPPVPPVSLRPDLDPGLQAIILKALAKDRTQRFQTCLEFFEALNYQMAETATRLEGSPVAESGSARHSQDLLKSWYRRGPIAVALMLAILAGVGAIAVTRGSFRLHAFRPSTVTAAQRSQQASPETHPGAGQLTPATPPPVAEPPIPPAPQPSRARMTSSDPPAGRSVAPKDPVTIRHPSPVLALPKAADVAPSRTAAPEIRSPDPPAPSHPQTVEAWLMKGDLAILQARYADALMAYGNAYRLKPQNRLVRRKLYDVLMLLGRPRDAEQYRR